MSWTTKPRQCRQEDDERGPGPPRDIAQSDARCVFVVRARLYKCKGRQANTWNRFQANNRILGSGAATRVRFASMYALACTSLCTCTRVYTYLYIHIYTYTWKEVEWWVSGWQRRRLEEEEKSLSSVRGENGGGRRRSRRRRRSVVA